LLSYRATQVSQEKGATQVSPVREIIEERMRITAEKCPYMRWEEFVIMPDHFHALIRMEIWQQPNNATDMFYKMPINFGFRM